MCVCGGGTWYVLCHDTELQYCLIYVSKVHSMICAGSITTVHVPATMSLTVRNMYGVKLSKLPFHLLPSILFLGILYTVML